MKPMDMGSPSVVYRIAAEASEMDADGHEYEASDGEPNTIRVQTSGELNGNRISKSLIIPIKNDILTLNSAYTSTSIRKDYRTYCTKRNQ